MAKNIPLSQDYKINIKRTSWTFEKIFAGFTEHINDFQSLDDWNLMALSNPIDQQSWKYIYAMAQGFNDYGEAIIDFYPNAIIRPADKSMNTIKEFIDYNVTEFFYEDYGLNAHNLLLEFIIYLGVRLNTTFDSLLEDVHKYITGCGMSSITTSFPDAFQMYFDACDAQNLGTKKERNLHKFAYYSLKPVLGDDEFEFFCKLIYSANLCRSMNRFTLGALDNTDQAYKANPFGFAPSSNESYNIVINNPLHAFGVIDFLGVHYDNSVIDFCEGLLVEPKLEQFIKREDLLLIIQNPFESYFELVNIFLKDYLPSFIKFTKFSKAYKVCDSRIEKSFFVWAQKKDNQEFILDIISHNIETSDNQYQWYNDVNNAFMNDTASNRLIISKLVEVERKSVIALSGSNWQKLADEYHRFFDETFVDQTKIENEVSNTLTKPILEPNNYQCFKPDAPKHVAQKKFVYTPKQTLPIPLSNIAKSDQSFSELFPNNLFVFDQSKIEEELLDQSSIRSIVELVSNAFAIAKQTAPNNSNILHRFVAITLFPDTFLSGGAIIPKGKVKVFQANQYPYLEGDVEIIASPKVRLFMRVENLRIRIVSFGNPNYH